MPVMKSLAASGVHPKVAQTIMRHSDINLTMSIYTHTLTGQESRAIANLPDLTQPSTQKQRAIATGTDNVIPSDWTHTGQTCVQQRLLANTDELRNRSNNSKTAILNTPGRTRTCDLRIRNPLLCPTELRALHALTAFSITTSLKCCQRFSTLPR